MRKIFLLRVFLFYRGDEGHEPISNPANFQSVLFNDLNSAVRAGKLILKEQIREAFRIDVNRNNYKKTDDFMEGEEERIDYVFEVQETDMTALKTWKSEYIRESIGDLSTKEDMARHVYNVISNPLYIIWGYDYKGNLITRMYCYDSDKRLPGGAWEYGFHVGCEFRPSDEKENAGKKYKIGDIVVEKQGSLEDIYVIVECPVKLYKYFSNEYKCCSIVNGVLEYDYFHEEDICYFLGEVKENISWVSKFYKNEIMVSDEDRAKIENGYYSFSEQPSYLDIKIKR